MKGCVGKFQNPQLSHTFIWTNQNGTNNQASSEFTGRNLMATYGRDAKSQVGLAILCRYPSSGATKHTATDSALYMGQRSWFVFPKTNQLGNQE